MLEENLVSAIVKYFEHKKAWFSYIIPPFFIELEPDSNVFELSLPEQ
jgi:hypothetical protein